MRRWRHLSCLDVISMPDTWEDPWFAAWDLAAQTIPLSRIDIAFARSQLLLLLQDRYQRPGFAAAALTSLLQLVQHVMWPVPGTVLEAAGNAGALRRILVLLGAGMMTGAGQLVLTRLSSGDGIDITAAIWFHAGRLPPLRTPRWARTRILRVPGSLPIAPPLRINTVDCH